MSQKKVGSDEWSITTASHHFGLVAQLAERPVVCGMVEGATPFGSAIFSRSVAQSSERPAWDREAAGENPAVPTISMAAVAEYMRHPPSKRNDAGGSPAGSANFRVPGGVKVA